MRNNGYHCPRSFGVQSLKKPLEIRVSTSNRGDGSGIPSLINVDTVKCVNVASFSYLLGIGNLCYCYLEFGLVKEMREKIC
jgi:hypothetical protein